VFTCGYERKRTEEAKIINDHLDGPNEAWNGVVTDNIPVRPENVPNCPTRLANKLMMLRDARFCVECQRVGLLKHREAA